MLNVIGKVLRWVFSRAAMVAFLWLFVVGSVATWLAVRHHFDDLPAQRETKLAELTQYRACLAEISAKGAELREAFEAQASAVAKKADAARAQIDGNLKSAEEIRDAIRQLEGRWARVRGVFDPSVQFEIRTKEREAEEAAAQFSKIGADLKALNAETARIGEAHDADHARLQQERESAKSNAAIAEGEIDVLEAEIARWQERLGGAKFWIGRALRLMFWSLVVATALLVVAPFLMRLLLFYLWAPLITRAGAVRLGTRGAPVPEIDVSSAEVAKEIVLQPGEFAIIKPSFYQASDDDLTKRTKFLFDWRYPITSLACGLVELTRVTNDATACARSITLSSKDKAEVELAVVEIPEGASLVCRPRHLAGLIGNGDGRPRIRTHWRLFSLHAWVTLQFRYFEFVGPGRLALWAVRGVRAELLQGDNDRRRRTNQDATIGFTPQLAYRSARAETFWAYLRSENPLFDDLFAGRGIFLCQQISGTGSAGVAGRFWSQLWTGVTRVFGL